MQRNFAKHRVFLAVGVFFLLHFAAHAQSAAELTPAEYAGQLDHAAAVIDPDNPDPAEMKALLTATPSAWKVRDGDTVYSVDARWLSRALSASALNSKDAGELLSEARRHLATLRESAETTATGAAPRESQNDLQASRKQLDGILSAKEFQGARGPTWLDEMKARFYRWLNRQLDKLHLPRSDKVGNTLAWLVIGLALILVAVTLVRVFVAGSSPRMDLRDASAPERSWREWLREAREAAANGDYRTAVHAAYWSAVARLNEANLLARDDSRTPRESLRMMRRNSAVYPPLAELTRNFEFVWYGERGATEMDWTDAVAQLERIECHNPSTQATGAS